MSETLSRLSTLLGLEKEPLIQRWTARLRSDARIPHAHALSEIELRDHIPTLVDELIESLALSARGDTIGATGYELANTAGAKEHARNRVNHAYELAEEMRELSHLRSVIIEACTRERVTLEGAEAQLV